jgi:C1A family cysteine protease
MAHAQKSLDEVRAAIQTEGLNWVAGETSVSGLTLEEKRRLCGFRPDMEQPAPMISPIMKMPLRAFPSTFDWRDNPSGSGSDWTTPVRNQGGCGSCVAFAVVGAFEACENINVYGTPDQDPDLSEQFLFSCGGGDCTNGWHFGGEDGALDYLKDVGVTDEACFPYQSGDGNDYPCDDRCADWASRVVTVADYAMISTDEPPADAVLKNFVQVQPVPCAMDTYASFSLYTGGVYERTTGDTLVGGHGVVIVGWDDTTSPPCWIAKNSWGSGWGESGYFRIKRGDSKIGIYAAFLDYDNAPPPLPSISGTVTLIGGSASPDDVVLELSGDASDTTAPALDGTYSFSDLEEGAYTVTPSLTRYDFEPPLRSYAPLNSAQAGQDFTGTYIPLTYATSLTPVGIVVLLSSFVVLVALIYRRKANVAQPSK